MMSAEDVPTWGEFIDGVKARLVRNIVIRCKDISDETPEQAAQKELEWLCDDIYKCIERSGLEEIIDEAKKYIREMKEE